MRIDVVMGNRAVPEIPGLCRAVRIPAARRSRPGGSAAAQVQKILEHREVASPPICTSPLVVAGVNPPPQHGLRLHVHLQSQNHGTSISFQKIADIPELVERADALK